MKFLIITNHSDMLWRFRRELIAKLGESGKVVISTPFVGHEKDFEVSGVRCVDIELDRREINPVKDFKLLKQYFNLLKCEKPDCVITYSIKPNIYAGYACKKLGIPYFANVQGLGTAFQKKLISAVVTLLYKTALRKVQTVFFENEENRTLFIDKKIIPYEKSHVLSGAGVNTDEFSFFSYPEENEGIHFLYLGRIMKEKGADELFAVAEKLKSKYGEKVAFDVVGFFEDEYRETVEKLSSEGVLTFHGFQNDPKPFYRAAHCIILPSYHEGLSNVLLEAASTGRALIASDIPGCREVVRDGVTGFLCKKASIADLERQIERFISLKSEERAEMGKCGSLFVKENFDKAQVVSVTFSIIKTRLNI